MAEKDMGRVLEIGGPDWLVIDAATSVVIVDEKTGRVEIVVERGVTAEAAAGKDFRNFVATALRNATNVRRTTRVCSLYQLILLLSLMPSILIN